MQCGNFFTWSTNILNSQSHEIAPTIQKCWLHSPYETYADVQNNKIYYYNTAMRNVWLCHLTPFLHLIRVFTASTPIQSYTCENLTELNYNIYMKEQRERENLIKKTKLSKNNNKRKKEIPKCDTLQQPVTS